MFVFCFCSFFFLTGRTAEVADRRAGLAACGREEEAGMEVRKCSICKKTALCNGAVCIDCRDNAVLAPVVPGFPVWLRRAYMYHPHACPCVLCFV
jgi:hypothetical protein